MENLIRNKTILVTGGTGSIGSEIVEQVLKYNPRQVRVFCRDESKQYYLQERLNYPTNLRLLIGDIRDSERLDTALKGVDIVFHAAALKHVPICEYNASEAVKTNIQGSQNVIESAVRNEIDRVVAISTDKVVDPNSIMGATKLVMEKLFINANYNFGKIDTKFSCVRFGNVTWSNGSVFPLWKKQIENNGTLSITDTNMTRFFMSIPQAVNLVLEAAKLSHGGEIFILKMPSIKIPDLAEIFVEKYFPNKDVKIKVIGKRLGEKINEKLFVNTENIMAMYENEKFFILTPEMKIYILKQPTRKYPGFDEVSSDKVYSSEDCIDIKKIKKII